MKKRDMKKLVMKLNFHLKQAKRMKEISTLQNKEINTIAKLQEAYDYLLFCLEATQQKLEKQIEIAEKEVQLNNNEQELIIRLRNSDHQLCLENNNIIVYDNTPAMYPLLILEPGEEKEDNPLGPLFTDTLFPELDQTRKGVLERDKQINKFLTMGFEIEKEDEQNFIDLYRTDKYTFSKLELTFNDKDKSSVTEFFEEFVKELKTDSKEK